MDLSTHDMPKVYLVARYMQLSKLTGDTVTTTTTNLIQHGSNNYLRGRNNNDSILPLNVTYSHYQFYSMQQKYANQTISYTRSMSGETVDVIDGRNSCPQEETKLGSWTTTN